MAADISLEREQLKPCCASWKDKYSKLEERRKALRQAVKLLEQQADKFQLDNCNLKKAYEEEQLQLKIEREESAKKSVFLTAQEKEISSLKSEVLVLKQRNNKCSEDVDNKLLQEHICEAEIEITNLKELLKKEKKKTVPQKKESIGDKGITFPSDDAEKSILRVRLSDCEGEINNLKELLDIEKIKADAEKKAATAEKNRATAAWKIAKQEKTKANDERLEAEAEKQKAEGYRALLESLKKELDDTRLKFASEAARFEQDKKKLEAEMQTASKQKTNVDKERKKTKEQKKLADVNSKLALKEKQRADSLDKQLAEEKIRVRGLCEEIYQLKSSMKSNELSSKTISPATEKGDHHKMNINSDRVNIETINKKANSKKRNEKEGKQVDKYVAASVSEILKTEILQSDPSKSSEIHGVACSERVTFLNKQLKFEKLQTKHAIKTAKLEKDRAQFLCRKLSCLKQEFVQFLYRMNILEGHYSFDTEGIHDLSKIPLQGRSLCNTLSADTKKSKLFHVPPSQLCIKGKHDLVVCDNIKQVIKDNSPSLMLSYCNCSKPLPSNASKFRSPSKGSKRIDNSAHAIDSSTASFSDPQMAGSQNKDCFSVLTSTEFSPGKEQHLDTLTNENGKQATAVSEKMGRANKKRKKASDVVESVEHKHPRSSKGLGLQTEDCFNSLPNIVINEEARPSEFTDKGIPNEAGNYKRRKKFYKQDETASEKEPVTKVVINAEDLPNICLDNCKKSLPNSHGYVIDDVNMNDLNLSTCFTDYMKLFELDNASEEERCRNVIEIPLSPTIPDLKFPDCDILEHKSLEEPLNEVTPSNEQWLSSSYNSNVINGLHENITQKTFQEVHNSDFSFDSPRDKSCDGCNTLYVQEAHTFNVIENTHKLTCITHMKYIIVFPDLKNTSSVSRIYCAARACAAKCCVLSDSGILMPDILFYLTTEDYLSPREKASTLFTVLFNHYVLFVLSATGDFCSSSWLSSCSSHFHLVFSKGIKSIFAEQCDVDSFFMVIDSFFTNREVLEHKDAAEIKRTGNIATEIMISFNFEGTNITLYPESALPVHIVGGSIILTLVCEALDRYSFMCEVSYKILHLNRFDSELKLCILHVFANSCGKKYLKSSHNVLIMTVIKSLVTFIEKEMSVVSYHTSSKTSSIFSPCGNCLFAEDALSVDNVVLLLFENIKRRPFGFCDLSLHEKACMGSSCVHEDMLESCFLQDLEMKTTENNCCIGHIVDVLSLLEIIALKMSWEWTYLKIVSPLFEIMESLENNSILVLVATLLGEVGRIGVENRGYADTGVHQLRQRLLLLLDRGDKSWFHIHIAAAQALVNILPFTSQQLPNCTPIYMESDLTPLKKWFASLSSQHMYQISSFC